MQGRLVELKEVIWPRLTMMPCNPISLPVSAEVSLTILSSAPSQPTVLKGAPSGLTIWSGHKRIYFTHICSSSLRVDWPKWLDRSDVIWLVEWRACVGNVLESWRTQQLDGQKRGLRYGARHWECNYQLNRRIFFYLVNLKSQWLMFGRTASCIKMVIIMCGSSAVRTLHFRV